MIYFRILNNARKALQNISLLLLKRAYHRKMANYHRNRIGDFADLFDPQFKKFLGHSIIADFADMDLKRIKNILKPEKKGDTA